MFLACWPAVAQARTAKNLGALNPLPFAFTFANCVGWLHYGFVCRNHYVFWSNALGCVLGLLYTTTALKLGCPDVVERVAVGGLVIQGYMVEGMKLAVGPFDNGKFRDVKVTSIRRNKAACR